MTTKITTTHQCDPHKISRDQLMIYLNQTKAPSYQNQSDFNKSIIIHIITHLNTINKLQYKNNVMAVHDIRPSFLSIRPRITPNQRTMPET